MWHLQNTVSFVFRGNWIYAQVTGHLGRDEGEKRYFYLLEGAPCLLFRLKGLVNDAAAFHIQAHGKEIPVLKLRISVIYYLHKIFTNVNEHITHIYISFLIGHLEENLFGSSPLLQF